MYPPNIYTIKIQQNEVPDYWPTVEWRSATPESQGMASAELFAMQTYIDEEALPIDSLLVIRNGYIVFEYYPNPAYDENTIHETWSVTKSITSLLFGIGIDHGHIEGVESRIVDIFSDRTIENLDDRKRAITVEHLLTMTAGIAWAESFHTPIMFESDDWVGFVLDGPMVYDPGVEWVYSSGYTHLLATILRRYTHVTPLWFAQINLFDPLGITQIEWLTDPEGTHCGAAFLRMTPRDLAKIGYLYLQNGIWDSEQIISASWVARSTQWLVSTTTGLGYGYQWYVNSEYGTFGARGWECQRIYVCPSRMLVIVITARSNLIPVSTLFFDYIYPSADYNTLTDVIAAGTTVLVIGLLVMVVLVISVTVSMVYRKRRTSHND